MEEEPSEDNSTDSFVFDVPTVELFESPLPVPALVERGHSPSVISGTEDESEEDSDGDFAKQLKRQRRQVLQGEKPAAPPKKPDFSQVLRQRRVEVLKSASMEDSSGCEEEQQHQTQQTATTHTVMDDHLRADQADIPSPMMTCGPNASFDTAEFEAELAQSSPGRALDDLLATNTGTDSGWNDESNDLPFPEMQSEDGGENEESSDTANDWVVTDARTVSPSPNEITGKSAEDEAMSNDAASSPQSSDDIMPGSAAVESSDKIEPEGTPVENQVPASSVENISAMGLPVSPEYEENLQERFNEERTSATKSGSTPQQTTDGNILVKSQQDDQTATMNDDTGYNNVTPATEQTPTIGTLTSHELDTEYDAVEQNTLSIEDAAVVPHVVAEDGSESSTTQFIGDVYELDAGITDMDSDGAAAPHVPGYKIADSVQVDENDAELGLETADTDHGMNMQSQTNAVLESYVGLEDQQESISVSDAAAATCSSNNESLGTSHDHSRQTNSYAPSSADVDAASVPTTTAHSNSNAPNSVDFVPAMAQSEYSGESLGNCHGSHGQLTCNVSISADAAPATTQSDYSGAGYSSSVGSSLGANGAFQSSSESIPAQPMATMTYEMSQIKSDNCGATPCDPNSIPAPEGTVPSSFSEQSNLVQTSEEMGSQWSQPSSSGPIYGTNQSYNTGTNDFGSNAITAVSSQGSTAMGYDGSTGFSTTAWMAESVYNEHGSTQGSGNGAPAIAYYNETNNSQMDNLGGPANSSNLNYYSATQTGPSYGLMDDDFGGFRSAPEQSLHGNFGGYSGPPHVSTNSSFLGSNNSIQMQTKQDAYSGKLYNGHHIAMQNSGSSYAGTHGGDASVASGGSSVGGVANPAQAGTPQNAAYGNNTPDFQSASTASRGISHTASFGDTPSAASGGSSLVGTPGFGTVAMQGQSHSFGNYTDGSFTVPSASSFSGTIQPAVSHTLSQNSTYGDFPSVTASTVGAGAIGSGSYLIYSGTGPEMTRTYTSQEAVTQMLAIQAVPSTSPGLSGVPPNVGSSFSYSNQYQASNAAFQSSQMEVTSTYTYQIATTQYNAPTIPYENVSLGDAVGSVVEANEDEFGNFSGAVETADDDDGFGDFNSAPVSLNAHQNEMPDGAFGQPQPHTSNYSRGAQMGSSGHDFPSPAATVSQNDHHFGAIESTSQASQPMNDLLSLQWTTTSSSGVHVPTSTASDFQSTNLSNGIEQISAQSANQLYSESNHDLAGNGGSTNQEDEFGDFSAAPNAYDDPFEHLAGATNQPLVGFPASHAMLEGDSSNDTPAANSMVGDSGFSIAPEVGTLGMMSMSDSNANNATTATEQTQDDNLAPTSFGSNANANLLGDPSSVKLQDEYGNIDVDSGEASEKLNTTGAFESDNDPVTSTTWIASSKDLDRADSTIEKPNDDVFATFGRPEAAGDSNDDDFGDFGGAALTSEQPKENILSGFGGTVSDDVQSDDKLDNIGKFGVSKQTRRNDFSGLDGNDAIISSTKGHDGSGKAQDDFGDFRGAAPTQAQPQDDYDLFDGFGSAGSDQGLSNDNEDNFADFVGAAPSSEQPHDNVMDGTGSSQAHRNVVDDDFGDFGGASPPSEQRHDDLFGGSDGAAAGQAQSKENEDDFGSFDAAAPTSEQSHDEIGGFGSVRPTEAQSNIDEDGFGDFGDFCGAAPTSEQPRDEVVDKFDGTSAASGSKADNYPAHELSNEDAFGDFSFADQVPQQPQGHAIGGFCEAQADDNDSSGDFGATASHSQQPHDDAPSGQGGSGPEQAKSNIPDGDFGDFNDVGQVSRQPQDDAIDAFGGVGYDQAQLHDGKFGDFGGTTSPSEHPQVDVSGGAESSQPQSDINEGDFGDFGVAPTSEQTKDDAAGRSGTYDPFQALPNDDDFGGVASASEQSGGGDHGGDGVSIDSQDNNGMKGARTNDDEPGDSSAAGNVASSSQSPNYNDFGDFGGADLSSGVASASEQPGGGDLGGDGVSIDSQDNNGVKGARTNDDEPGDSGATGNVASSSQSPNDDDFGDFGGADISSNKFEDGTLGDFAKASTVEDEDDDFGDFGGIISNQSLDDGFGDFNGASAVPKQLEDDDFGDVGAQDDGVSKKPQEIDDFGDFDEAPPAKSQNDPRLFETNVDDDDFGDFGTAPSNSFGNDEDFGDFDSGSHLPGEIAAVSQKKEAKPVRREIADSVTDLFTKLQQKYPFDTIETSGNFPPSDLCLTDILESVGKDVCKRATSLLSSAVFDEYEKEELCTNESSSSVDENYLSNPFDFPIGGLRVLDWQIRYRYGGKQCFPAPLGEVDASNILFPPRENEPLQVSSPKSKPRRRVPEGGLEKAPL